MEQLTLENLKQMPGGIFKSGTGFIIHPWFNDAKILYNEQGEMDENTERKYCEAASAGYIYAKVKWVAVRGHGFHDWKIYHSLDGNLCRAPFFDDEIHLKATPSRIAAHGAKLIYENKIKEFVPCDDEAFKMYRY